MLSGALSTGQALDVRNVQSASISPRNLTGGEPEFNRLVDALSESAELRSLAPPSAIAGSVHLVSPA
jgi:hypothetical protein